LVANVPTTLLESISVYVGTLKKDDTAHTRKELQRFVTWCGPNRVIRQITPSAIGDYANSIAGSGTTPQAAERLQVVRKFLTFARKKQIIEVNLAQHVRVRRAKTRQGRTVLQEEEQIELTADGHKQLVGELKTLKAQLEPLAAEIQRAAADKDVRENAPLEAAREDKGRVDSRIRDIAAILNSAVVIDASDPSRSQTVKLGTKVKVQDISPGRSKSEPTEYIVVSASEARPLERKISDVSPLGKALLGRAAGHEVDTQTPRGKMKYKILNIS
jgi:transcription elongation factor GreA